jgi:FKBP-type peptidyl-prolyl cis-trans isomerase
MMLKHLAFVFAALLAVSSARAATPAQNLAAANQFLAANKVKPGILTTASGLQYRILQPGKGRKPVALDEVLVHYRGRLMNGRVFDSSYERREPARFPLTAVIPGWTEGLQLIGEGGKLRLFVPPRLGYGDRGGGPIPPNSLLIFDVELLRVIKR